MTTTPFLFFDCWSTLFTADLAEDFSRITSLLDVPYNTASIKAFEAATMTRPELDLRPGVRQFMASLGRPADEAVLAAIIEILEAGFGRQRPYGDTLLALRKLRKTYRLGLVTNSSRAAFEHLAGAYELYARFDVVAPSYEVGAVKPDRRIYDYALAQAGVPAAHAVMIGDSPSDDYAGALQAKFGGAILLDRRQRHPGHAHRITELSGLERALMSLSI